MRRLTFLALFFAVTITATAQDKVEWASLAEVEYEETENNGQTTWIPQFSEEVASLIVSQLRCEDDGGYGGIRTPRGGAAHLKTFRGFTSSCRRNPKTAKQFM